MEEKIMKYIFEIKVSNNLFKIFFVNNYKLYYF